MEKELKIFVAGTANSGKSNMMYYLQELLQMEGFTVEIDFEDSDYTGANDFRKHMVVNLDERQRLLKDMTKITLKEIQLVREIKQDTKA